MGFGFWISAGCSWDRLPACSWPIWEPRSSRSNPPAAGISSAHHYFATGEVQDPITRPRVAQAYAVKCADGRLIGLHLSTPDKVWKGLLIPDLT